MDDYTKDDVITALSKIPMNSRQRVLVDQRSYLMGLLAFRFMMAEHAIAKATGIKRDKVNYNKKLVLQFSKDKSYIQNVYVYAQMFPFNFNVIDSSRPHRMKRVELDLDQKFFNKLKATGSILGHDDIRMTIKFLLEKSMKLWEE
jgi:hypothetical protein